MKLDLNAPPSRAEAAAVNLPLIQKLQQKLEAVFGDVAKGYQRYAIADFPNHANIGDSAIYVGEAVLTRKQFGYDPEFVTEARPADLSRIAANGDDTLLLLHGGGNFGDLYPLHQEFREAVVTRFAQRRIVLMPQSIHFTNTAAAERSARVFNRHKDFVMLVRDEPSADLARKYFECRIELVPDAAFMIGPVAPSIEPDLAVLALLRLDIETTGNASADLGALPKPNSVVDWPEERIGRNPFNRLPAAFRGFLPPALQGYRPVTPAAFEALAARRLATGFRILSRGRAVVTDRLHGHIMSVLLGVPHVALDNSYRKIGNFVDAWTSSAAFRKAESLSEVLASGN